MGSGMNPNKMLKQMQQMQADMEKAQQELNEQSVSAKAGGGAVEVKVSGGMELLEIKIDPAAVDPEDVELLEDTVVAAVNEGMRAAQEMANARLGKLTGGLGDLGIPGL